MTVVLILALACGLTAVRVSRSDASTGDARSAATSATGSTTESGPDGASGRSDGQSGSSAQEAASGSGTTGASERIDDGKSSGGNTGDSTSDGDTSGTGGDTGAGSDNTGVSSDSDSDSGAATHPSTSATSTGGDTSSDPAATTGSSTASDAWRSNLFAELPRRWGVRNVYVNDGPSYGLQVSFADNERPEVGDIVATVKYLEYACTGTWTLDALTSTTVVLHEKMKVDRTAPANRQCAPEASVELERRSPGRIHYEATGYGDTADADYLVVPAVGTLIPT